MLILPERPLRSKLLTGPAQVGARGRRLAAEGGEQVQAEPEFGEGIIEISGKGFGFLRDSKRNFVQTPQDIFVTPEIVRRFGLRDGMWIYGETRRGSRGRNWSSCSRSMVRSRRNIRVSRRLKN